MTASIFACRWRLAASLLAVAGLVAAEERAVELGERDMRAGMAVLVPGREGAWLCGKGAGGTHVDFRVDFGADLMLLVNGRACSTFDPAATYCVVFEWANVDSRWFVTTRIFNVDAGGAPVCEQVACPVEGGPGQVRVVAAAVHHLAVR